MPHQEARFLIPAVPLLLTVTPTSLRPIPKQIFLALWIVFNLAFGVLMGCYHQAGVVPAQAWLGELQAGEVDNVVYWKTYSPPSWLLGTMNEKANLTDLMGAPVKEMVKVMDDIVCRVGAESKGDFLVAPLSAVKLDPYVENDGGNWRLEEAKTVRRHLNMDDLDIGEEGLAGTWKRVVGRRGLRIWRVVRKEGACEKK